MVAKLQFHGLTLAGFRGIQLEPPVTLEFSKFTLIVGPNSTSKSSILEFLARAWNPSWSVEDSYKELGKTYAKVVLSFEKQTLETLIRITRKIIEEHADAMKSAIKEGTFDEIIMPFVESMSINYGASKDIKESMKSIASLYVEKVFNALRRTECVRSVAMASLDILKRGKLEVALEITYVDGPKVRLLGLARHAFPSEDFTSCVEAIKKVTKEVFPTSIISNLNVADQTFVIFTNMMLDWLLDALIRNFIAEHVLYISSNRSFLCSSKKISRADTMKDVIERMISLSPSPEIYEKAMEFMKLFGVSRVRIIPKDNEIVIDLYDSNAGEWVNVSRSAFGACSSLPIVLSMPTLEGTEVVLIDDVEMGLHPAAQMRLIDFLISVLNKTDTQIVLTTHSGVVFEYILYKVVSGELKKDDVKINIMYRDPESGIIRAKTITPDIPLEIDDEVERALKEFGTSGLFTEQQEIGWKIVFSKGVPKSEGLKH